jgi:hypothetical protein
LTPQITASPVNVIGHLKGSLDQLHSRGGFHQYLHYIEPIRHPRIIEQSEPFFGASDDSVLLRLNHRGVRRAECICRARFHLNENQCVFASIAANQIDFPASSRSEIPVENTETIPTKIVGGDFFAQSAKRQMWRGKSAASQSWPESNEKQNTFARPAQTNGDESDKVHESVSFQGALAFHSLCFDQNHIAENHYAIFSSYGLA